MPEDDHKSHAHHLTNTDLSQTSSSYGARYGTFPLPKYKIPSKVCFLFLFSFFLSFQVSNALRLIGDVQGTDAESAYQLVHDELALDGSPLLNLASFVHTWMPAPADKLMQENMSKNLIDQDEYPMTRGSLISL